MKQVDSRFAGELMEAKPLLKGLTKKFHAANMSECVRQIILQIDREAERLGVDSLSYGDVTLRPRQ